MLPCSISTSDRTTSLSLLAPTPNWSAHRAGCGGWKGQRARCVEPPFQVHAASTYLPHLRRWPRHAMHGAETWTQLLPQSQQARKTVNERNTIGKTGHFLARARQPNLFLCCFNPFLYLSGCGCWRVPFCWFVSACLFYFREKKKSVLCHSFKRGELWEREKKKKKDGRKESFVGLRSRRVIGLVARGLSKATDRKMEMSVAERVKGVTGVWQLSLQDFPLPSHVLVLLLLSLPLPIFCFRRLDKHFSNCSSSSVSWRLYMSFSPLFSGLICAFYTLFWLCVCRAPRLSSSLRAFFPQLVRSRVTSFHGIF